MGPWYMAANEREARRFDRQTGKFKDKAKRKEELKEELRAKGIDVDNGNLTIKKLQDLAACTVPTQTLIYIL